MALKALKGQLHSLTGGFTDALGIDNPFKGSSAMDAGKMAAVLTKKSPFEIPDAPNQQTVKNPLSFSSVTYPLDLGSTELGHWMVFESGYDHMDTEGWDNSFNNTAEGPSGKITSKTPTHSITTSGIAMYMPQNIKVSYTQNYEQDETGFAGDMENMIKDVMNAPDAGAKLDAGLQNVVGPIAREAKKAIGELSSMAGLGDPFRLAMKRGGQAINPRNEMFYNTPEMRNFTFEFDFWPRNEKEAQVAEQIIHIFKYNAAPGLDESGAIFSIPNYWNIRYMKGSQINTALHRFSRMYCTGVNIDYAPDGQYTTFKSKGDESKGYPVHTKLTVTFVEDAILTKGSIEQGM